MEPKVALRTLVIGSDSTIGRALAFRAQYAGDHVIGTSRRLPLSDDRSSILLDLTSDSFSADGLPDADVVYLCAAMTRFVDCEANPKLAKLVNVVRIGQIAQHYLQRGSFVVFLSSSAVFSGHIAAPLETATAAPVTTYGKQKYEAEQLLVDIAKSYKAGRLSIVRMTKVLSPDFPLLRQWRAELENGQTIRPLSDLILCPIALPYVTASLYELGLKRKSGVFHISGHADLSYAELASLLADRWGYSKILVKPSNSDELGVNLLSNPRYSSLGMARTTMELGIRPQSLQDLVEELSDA